MQQPPTRGTYWLIKPQLWLSVSAAAVAAPGIAVNMIDAHHRDAGERLMPELMWIVDASAIALLVALVAPIAVLLWKGRARLAGRRPRVKVIYWLLSLMAQGITVAALLGALIFSNFHLFDGSYLGVKARSPSGDRTAYLYSGGLFCGYEVFVRQDGQATLHELDSFTCDCNDRPTHPRLRWSPGGSAITVVGEDGTPVPHKQIHLFPPWN